ncbi:Zinc transporter 3 [Linum grandiflorum]
MYKENSPTALIVVRSFNSASAGILVYLALVYLLAADFMNPKIQSSGRLQISLHIALMLGAGFMSILVFVLFFSHKKVDVEVKKKKLIFFVVTTVRF